MAFVKKHWIWVIYLFHGHFLAREYIVYKEYKKDICNRYLVPRLLFEMKLVGTLDLDFKNRVRFFSFLIWYIIQCEDLKYPFDFIALICLLCTVKYKTTLLFGFYSETNFQNWHFFIFCFSTPHPVLSMFSNEITY